MTGLVCRFDYFGTHHKSQRNAKWYEFLKASGEEKEKFFKGQNPYLEK